MSFNPTNIVIGVISIALTFGLAVFIHEFGHMFFALVRGVGVESFAIGMGPKIFAWHWKGIEFSLRWFPIGGFVKLQGMMPDEQAPADGGKPAHGGATDEPGGTLTLHDIKVDDGHDKSDKTMTEASYDDLLALADKGFLTKLLVFGGGVFMNFLTAIVAMVFFLYIPHKEPRYEPIVDKVAPGSPAAQAGFQSGDRITAYNGKPVKWENDIDEMMSKEIEGRGKDFDMAKSVLPMAFTVSRSSQTLPLALNNSTVTSFAKDVTIVRPAYIGDVAMHQPAEKAGIKAGDVVTAVNGKPVNTFDEMAAQIRVSLGKPIKLQVRRGTELKDFTVTPTENMEDFKKGAIGIVSGSPFEANVRFQDSFGRAIVEAPMATIKTAGMLAYMQYDFFRRANVKLIANNLGGPIAIADVTQRKAKQGLSPLLDWFIKFNLLLMMFNLLPIPVLDGGFILLALIESVTRRPVSPRVLQPIYTMFVIFFISLMVIISFLDIKRYF